MLVHDSDETFAHYRSDINIVCIFCGIHCFAKFVVCVWNNLETTVFLFTLH